MQVYCMEFMEERKFDLRPEEAVGFSIAFGLTQEELIRWRIAHNTILGEFPWLKASELQIDSTRLMLWSHTDPLQATYKAETGETWILAGSPWSRSSWRVLTFPLSQKPETTPSSIEGRWVLIRVPLNSEQWELWNDWAAALPVYFAPLREGGIVSCLEPVVTKVADLTLQNFSRRGLVELLLLGHFLGTDTLYEPMNVLSPDSHAVWKNGRLVKTSRLWSVYPTEPTKCDRQASVKTMHDLTVRCVTEAMVDDKETRVLVPLSSGVDSRIIACIVASMNVPREAYSYGPKESSETDWARQVALSLKLPWRRIDVGVDYLTDHTCRWLQWFGSSLHAHGMYQLQFLDTLEDRRGFLPNGFYGNNMAGGDHPNDCLFEVEKGLLDRFCGYGTFWDKDSLINLLDFDPHPYFVEMDMLLQDQVRQVRDWPQYQQMNFIDMTNRQARYITYQPTMYSYFGLERSPFMNRDYARFCMALPTDLLRKRKLQIEMLDQYWPIQSKIGGTFRPRRGIARKWHAVRLKAANRLPPQFRTLAGVTSVNKWMGPDCAQRHGRSAFPAIPASLSDTGPLRSAPILNAIEYATKGSRKDLQRVLSVQTVFHALQNVDANSW
jgi:Asparagine synthase